MATKCSSRARTSKRSVKRPQTSSRPPAFEDSIRASSRTESTSRRRRGRPEMAEEKEPKAEASEREEGKEGGGRRGGRRSPRASGEAETGASPEKAPRPAIREERGAPQVPPPGVVPLPEVRRRVAEAPRRPVEAPSPLRLSVEPPVDRVSGPARGSRPSPERFPGGPRAQRTATRWPGRDEAGGPDRPRGRQPQARDDREGVGREGPPR